MVLMVNRNQQLAFQPAGSKPGRRMLFLLSALILCAACSSSKLLMTKTLNFRCDSNFNDGFILPVDIVYIPEGESADAINGISPDDWFDSKVRDEWPYTQTLSFIENNVRSTVKIELKKAQKTTKMLVIADYRGLSDSKTQLITFTADSKENENIFITINGLLH